MINKRCPNEECNSTNTYAVPSRAQVIVGPDGKVTLDEWGYAKKIMCRRCRNCGQDYLDDQKPKHDINKLPPEMQRVLKAVQDIRDKKNKVS